VSVLRPLSRLLCWLYRLKICGLRRVILGVAKRLEGGQMYSHTMRLILSKYHKIEIGKYSYGGCFNTENIRAFTRIGRYCSFADDVYIFNANHPLSFLSTHPFFYNPKLGCVENEQISRRWIEIGNDVWVGQNAIILAGVKRIGDGAVIGAGAVVTKDVPDFAVVVGNPGKIVKRRFSAPMIRRLKHERWWEKGIETLKQNIGDFVRPLEEAQETVQPGLTSGADQSDK